MTAQNQAAHRDFLRRSLSCDAIYDVPRVKDPRSCSVHYAGQSRHKSQWGVCPACGSGVSEGY